ncbi:flagellar hook-associated protein FlgK [Paraferrimonas sp. SM1919]|uniref:flagellar hook-associated protein FlgK n=1 Tax=Paraferrimonas sp. SM1919 TaxID=2662263 RepID=UPI0013D438F8|nr:flagellar hook-associated protein FlgK [Paraferrimonas sp. SM1919]
MNMINIGLSGINAANINLNYTSNNIANMLTPGFSRLEALQETANAFSKGVQITGARRITDGFLTEQVWRTSSVQGFNNNVLDGLSKLETIVASDSNNIGVGFDELFAAFNAAMEQPNATAQRQQILNESNSIAKKFNQLAQSFDTEYTQVTNELNAGVNTANQLMANIADLNQKIQQAQGQGRESYNLQDKRDEAIKQLSDIVQVRATENNDGTINLSLPDGQPLVLSTTAAKLAVYTDPVDTSMNHLQLELGGQQFQINQPGGKLGGTLHYRDNHLAGMRDSVNELALTFANEINGILNNGFDLNGNPGASLFSFDATNPAATLSVTAGLSANDLAFSQNGAPGDNSNLKDLIDLKDRSIYYNSLGQDATLHEVFSNIVGDLAISTRQAQMEVDAGQAMKDDAIAKRDSVSAVNEDEELANIMIYSQNYQANAKVVSTADELFNTLINTF